MSSLSNQRAIKVEGFFPAEGKYLHGLSTFFNQLTKAKSEKVPRALSAKGLFYSPFFPSSTKISSLDNGFPGLSFNYFVGRRRRPRPPHNICIYNGKLRRRLNFIVYYVRFMAGCAVFALFSIAHLAVY